MQVEHFLSNQYQPSLLQVDTSSHQPRYDMLFPALSERQLTSLNVAFSLLSPQANLRNPARPTETLQNQLCHFYPCQQYHALTTAVTHFQINPEELSLVLANLNTGIYRYFGLEFGKSYSTIENEYAALYTKLQKYTAPYPSNRAQLLVFSLRSGLISPTLLAHSTKRILNGGEECLLHAVSQLSPRQFQVFTAKAMGYDHATIADALGISIHSVASHTRILYKRLDLYDPISITLAYHYLCHFGPTLAQVTNQPPATAPSK